MRAVWDSRIDCSGIMRVDGDVLWINERVGGTSINEGM